MSIAASAVVNCTSMSSLHLRSESFSRNSTANLVKLKLKDQSLFWAMQSLHCASKNTGIRKDIGKRRNFVVKSCAVPPTSEPPFNLLNWVLGFAVTVVVPFITHKWTSLLKLKNDVENTVETVEHIVEAVEKVAEEVEKVAEDIAADLPADGKLRNVVDFVEHVAEKAAKDAHLVGDLIDKVQDAEENVEVFVESIVEGAKEHQKEAEEPTLTSNL